MDFGNVIEKGVLSKEVGKNCYGTVTNREKPVPFRPVENDSRRRKCPDAEPPTRDERLECPKAEQTSEERGDGIEGAWKFHCITGVIPFRFRSCNYLA